MASEKAFLDGVAFLFLKQPSPPNCTRQTNQNWFNLREISSAAARSHYG